MSSGREDACDRFRGAWNGTSANHIDECGMVMLQAHRKMHLKARYAPVPNTLKSSFVTAASLPLYI